MFIPNEWQKSKKSKKKKNPENNKEKIEDQNTNTLQIFAKTTETFIQNALLVG